MASTQLLHEAHALYVRSGAAASDERPPIYKTVGIVLAVASGLFIGVSFIFSKMGLLKSNEKYDQVPGEGYAYLKNAWWWGGMSLMIVGELCNFAAYAFTDAILVASMGALSVVISTVLSAIFLKERLSAVGMVGCFLCVLGSVVIALNTPSSSAVTNIQQMQHYVLKPGILAYGGVVIVGCLFIIFWVGPRYGTKTVMVYLSVCSLIGGLSVVATQGLGSAVLAQVAGEQQFNQWFLYVLLVFVVITLVTEIVFLMKALNIFNAALVTPTYYVYFTSATIVTSAILFGFNGTVTQIITIIMGFLTICSGVTLLQLSKSSKDVPDAAVFSGNLDQLRTIAEQEQPEYEPKADSIRGTAAIIRRLSSARQNMELAEARRLHAELHSDLEPVGENEQIEWDGLRRRRTTLGSHHTRPFTPRAGTLTPVAHPPLGMSHFPTEAELQERENRPATAGLGGLGSGFLGSLRARARTTTGAGGVAAGAHSPLMHPVPLTEIAVPGYSNKDEAGAHEYGVPGGDLHAQKTAYDAHHQHVQFRDADDDDARGGDAGAGGGFLAVERPAQSARRQFSFHNVFRKGNTTPTIEDVSDAGAHRARLGLRSRAGSSSRVGTSHGLGGVLGLADASEEERAGLVKADSGSGRSARSEATQGFPGYEEEEGWLEEKAHPLPPPVPRHGREELEGKRERAFREQWGRREGSGSRSPPPPPGSGAYEGGGRGRGGPLV